MPIPFTCTCGHAFEVADDASGQPATCPACGALLASTAVQADVPPMKAPANAAAAPPPKAPAKRSALPWILGGVAAGVLLCACLPCGAMGLFVMRTGSALGDVGKKEVARAQAFTLTAACDAYKLKHGRYPAMLIELTLPDEFGQRFLEGEQQLLDPWGLPFRYNAAGPRNHGMCPDIGTTAPDGTEIGNWQKIR